MVKNLPSNSLSVGLILSQGAKISDTLGPKNTTTTTTKTPRKTEKYCYKFNEDFKIGPRQKNLFKKSLKI